MLYAKVAVFNYTQKGSEIFTYQLASEMEGKVLPGQVVEVPFGRREIQGLVLEILSEKPAFPTKPILKVTNAEALPPHLVRTIFYLRNNYVASLKSCLNAVLPFDFAIKRRKTAEKNVLTKESASFLVLNTEQQAAFEKIQKATSAGNPEAFMLMGITGSGKTEIYLHAIRDVLEKNQDAIVLVPEIALTPQVFSIFESRFPGKVAVWHSQLKGTEKFRLWQEMHSGQKKIVVGSRSALFAPFKNLGLIVIDEEQEGSFKQDQSPRYQTREVALNISQLTGASIVFGSATPSLETYYHAQSGIIQKLILKNRATKSLLPQVEIVDLRDEFKKGNKSIFSEKLQHELQETLTNKRQAIVFINRRGAATFILCRDCGWVAKCPNCEIPYTYHLTNNSLICHHCNKTSEIPTICPNCQSAYIKFFGIGTQKVEYELKKLFPNARIGRMDRDSTQKRDSHKNIYEDFKNHQIDILIGTQMIAKGWDIANVNLVGVISADNALFIPDFRAEEKTFQLLVQVAGRAGRGVGDIGKVVIQTYNPDNRAIQMVADYRVEAFYDSEILNRQKYSYPPFVNLVKIMYNDESQNKAFSAAEGDKKKLTSYTVLGPTPSFIPKINNKFRYLLILKLDDQKLAKFLEEIAGDLQGIIDVNPQSLLN